MLSPNGANAKEIDLQPQAQVVSAFNPRMTAVGELVYQRHPLDFKAMNKSQKRDFVLEENLLDVKKLLKTSSFIDKT